MHYKQTATCVKKVSNTVTMEVTAINRRIIRLTLTGRPRKGQHWHWCDRDRYGTIACSLRVKAATPIRLVTRNLLTICV